MNTIELIQKLHDIERSIGVEDSSSLRRKVVEALECAVRIQRESPEQLRRQSRLNISDIGFGI